METSTVINWIMFSSVPVGALVIWLYYRRQRKVPEQQSHQPHSKLTSNNSAEISNSHQVGASYQGSE
ncbi:hypothetical protein SAMN06265373_11152 [Shimia sagamensis]|uniref:Uncharacterized protein n=1 Tax=Shimia sagamensis TaxID=1566352 RepID=A0ABY1PK70_9RHOB|nr:hypothetical protein SAMN06265373_11152 [Shimia sagamensis]